MAALLELELLVEVVTVNISLCQESALSSRLRARASIVLVELLPEEEVDVIDRLASLDILTDDK